LLLRAYGGKQLSEEAKRRLSGIYFKERCREDATRRCRCDCQFEAELLFLAVPSGDYFVDKSSPNIAWSVLDKSPMLFRTGAGSVRKMAGVAMIL
jgi:hypothetical protein